VRHRRLAHPQHGRQIAHAQLAVRQGVENPHPRRIPERAEGIGQPRYRPGRDERRANLADAGEVDLHEVADVIRCEHMNSCSYVMRRACRMQDLTGRPAGLRSGMALLDGIATLDGTALLDGIAILDGISKQRPVLEFATALTVADHDSRESCNRFNILLTLAASAIVFSLASRFRKPFRKQTSRSVTSSPSDPIAIETWF